MVSRFSPYIVLNNQANEAIDFYTEVFNAHEGEPRLFLRDFAEEMEFVMTDGFKNNVMHGQLQVGDTQIYIADAFPGQDIGGTGSLVTVMVEVESKEAAAKIFNDLSKDGKVIMELSATSFTDAMGTVEDKYGVQWLIMSSNM